MTGALSGYRAAGYFLTRGFARPDYASADLLPSNLVSMSSCLAEFFPDVWTLTWTNTAASERLEKAASFGIAAEALPEVSEWATEEFDRSWGWPSVLFTLDAARLASRRFLAQASDLRLLGLALPEDLAPTLLDEARPGPREGATGLFRCIASGEPPAEGGTPIGWEILGFDHGSFHSWLCNGLEAAVFRALEIRPGRGGLIEELVQARRAAEHCGQEHVGAEPGLWLPWLLIEYPLAHMADACRARRFMAEETPSCAMAAGTLQILEAGQFEAPTGEPVLFGAALDRAIEGTVLYGPELLVRLLGEAAGTGGPTPRIDVTDESTQEAAKRLVEAEGCDDLVLLNFASARNPGGGFLRGAKAQEEDLARCGGLYPCLLTQPGYYDANRATESLLYTDHVIYSPRVPWFRVRGSAPPESVFLASVITAPAPNAGQLVRRDPNAGEAIETALRRRAGMVLAIARSRKHRNVLLGAWGCGVFRNSPALVADAFGTWLESSAFRGAFDRVVFAILDTREGRRTLRAFQERFV